MYRHINLKRGHIKVGNSIINVSKKQRNKSPDERKEIEIKIRDMNIENKKRIKPLTFKF
jgi:hypothetical protein